MKSLGLDQTLIGGVTTLSIGGSKGGSDFSPKGKNPNEIKTFSDAYMRELYKKLGKNFEISKEDNGVDDKGLLIQFSNVNGDYSGALHFDPKAYLGLVKALGLDQTLSHGLTTLTLGGAKGGSDFIPENKSPN
ncbi:nadp-specific glutamate dehydrogenase 1-related [Anaeramoeba flamelloides]|uniref:Nadp-specific glutamate dehydrogenase 1-related n=1 Tax=Anaeramoeba flamelloides TaxID=1746091 RepID=A0ABQ8XXG9_9EUKA|nr:nadp-specific glutamate dehydrogenase 1-related [Anaeramoeba flamelloides]